MKKFNIKFSKFIYALIALGTVFGLASIIVTVYLIFTQGVSQAVDPLYPILQYTISIVFGAILLIVVISLPAASYYAVDDKYFITNFGIIKSRYKLDEIERITLNKKQTAKTKLSAIDGKDCYTMTITYTNQTFAVFTVN
ncbi:MAG: hypothetical protein MJ091_07055, partial [Clostridia bacterium]|nr:hypothetical protein [Clostridia bacterium]